MSLDMFVPLLIITLLFTKLIYRQKDNSIPSEIEFRTLRRFIKARERELNAILAQTSDEQDQLDLCSNAIFNLELALSEGKEIIKANEDSLTSLITIQSRLGDINSITQKEMKEEPSSKVIYTKLRDYSEKPVIRMSDLIDEQLGALREDVRALWDHVRQVEMELSGWISSKRLSEAVIKRLSDGRSGIEVDLKAAKQAFGPMRRIPSDVWVKIFHYAIQQARDEYMKGNTTGYGMRPPMYNLSQVCQRWRELVQNDPGSWRLVYVAPCQVWRQDEYDLVNESVRKSAVPITILTNLSQSLLYGYQYNYRYDQNGNHLTCVSPNETTLFRGKGYKLLVNMNNDDSGTMSRLSYLPLRQASSLVFYGRSSFSYGYLFNYASYFGNITSLSCINDSPSLFPNVTLSSYFPQLCELDIQVKKFPPNFYLNNYLPVTLQELRLRNDNGGISPTMSTEIDLPRLLVLEITFPGTYLLDRLTAKGLETLTFYGPHEYGGTQASSSNKATTIYRQVLHLKFEDWRIPNATDGPLGAAEIFAQIYIPPPNEFPEIYDRSRNLESEERKIVSPPSGKKKKKGKKESKAPSIWGLGTVSSDHIKGTVSPHTLTFSRSFVHGGTLVSAVKGTMKEHGNSKNRGNLKDIAFIYTNGITNRDCDELRKLVKSVNVYM
jgi:hypothetical protein